METALTQNKSKSKSEHTILEVLEFCKAQGLPARVVGKWVWIKFQDKPGADVLQSLKDFGFYWSRRRGQWSHSCGHSSRPALNYRPWDRYDTVSLDDACARLAVT